MNPNKTKTLESFVSTAEYVIANYLKDHNGCTREKLMPHVLNILGTHENKEGEIVTKIQSIHTLAFILAVKELEKESVIRIERFEVPFPMLDNKSQFSLA
jgi:hypothetical protein